MAEELFFLCAIKHPDLERARDGTSPEPVPDSRGPLVVVATPTVSAVHSS